MSYYHNNYHTNDYIKSCLYEHVKDARYKIGQDRIFGVFYQGSGNYGLDYEGSDVDTKCIVIPSVEDLHNMQKMSETLVRDNDEHIDFKDVRLMFDIFMKQNVNFIEILYTPFCWINPKYKDLWDEIIKIRDDIVMSDRLSLLKSLKGIAGEKYHALEHRYPSRIEWLDKFGYDPKQLHHLIRIEEFTRRWLNGEPFENCLISKMPHELVEMKKGWADLEQARKFADDSMHNIKLWYEEYSSVFADDDKCLQAKTKAKLDEISMKLTKRYLRMLYHEI